MNMFWRGVTLLVVGCLSLVLWWTGIGAIHPGRKKAAEGPMFEVPDPDAGGGAATTNLVRDSGVNESGKNGRPIEPSMQSKRILDEFRAVVSTLSVVGDGNLSPWRDREQLSKNKSIWSSVLYRRPCTHFLLTSESKPFDPLKAA